jgi:MoaA/NifB/PqqE/SkfB family radical SAM enzyme
VFGGEQANNFFVGRRTAHEETMHGAEILLAHGILPRFQIYLNRVGIDTIPEFLDELGQRGILDEIERQGARPQIHCMTYGLQGFGRINRRYAIEPGDVARIPKELLASTAEHFGRPLALCGEAEFAERILAGADGLVYPEKHWLWFFVDQAWDVYPNLSEMHAAWRLGNLRTDDWRTILHRYVDDEAPAAKLLFSISRHDLVRRNRGQCARMAFMSEGDLLDYYMCLEAEKSS